MQRRRSLLVAFSLVLSSAAVATGELDRRELGASWSAEPGQQQVVATLVRDMKYVEPAGGFVPIAGASTARDGRIAVIQAQDHRVLVYPASGGSAKVIGRRGAGPGEFIGLNRVGWTADSLWVFDPAAARLTVFRPDGVRLRTVSLASPGVSSAARTFVAGRPFRVLVLAVAANGALLGELRYLGNGGGTSDFVRLSPTGEVESRIAQVARGVERIAIDNGGRLFHLSVPLAWPTIVLADPLESRLGYVRQPGSSGDDVDVEVSLFDATGVRSVAAFLRIAPRALPPGARDAAITRLLAGLDKPTVLSPNAPAKAGAPLLNPEAKRVAEQQLRTTVPKHYAPVTAALVGVDGSLWLEQDDHGVAVTYVVLNRDGARRFSVRLGRHQELLAASLDRVWISELDADDVPSLVRYRVNR
jgi:hypothetical protein